MSLQRFFCVAFGCAWTRWAVEHRLVQRSIAHPKHQGRETTTVLVAVQQRRCCKCGRTQRRNP